MSKRSEILKLLSSIAVSTFMSWSEILSEIIFCLVFGSCFAVYIGILVITVGLRELQTNLKIREIGKNLFRKLF